MVEMKEVNEQTRTYIFPNGTLGFENVVAVGITDSTHRLNSKDGTKYIVNNGWLAIKLDGVEEWSF